MADSLQSILDTLGTKTNAEIMALIRGNNITGSRFCPTHCLVANFLTMLAGSPVEVRSKLLTFVEVTKVRWTMQRPSYLYAVDAHGTRHDLPHSVFMVAAEFDADLMPDRKVECEHSNRLAP